MSIIFNDEEHNRMQWCNMKKDYFQLQKGQKWKLISVEIIVVINSKNCERLISKVLSCSHL